MRTLPDQHGSDKRNLHLMVSLRRAPQDTDFVPSKFDTLALFSRSSLKTATQQTTHNRSFRMTGSMPESCRSTRFPAGRIAVSLAGLFRIVVAGRECRSGLRLRAIGRGKRERTVSTLSLPRKSMKNFENSYMKAKFTVSTL